jgi:CBS domain-containing protein
MQKIREIMSREVHVLSPRDSVMKAAVKMRQLDVGAVPVCDGEKLVGMITDRDITVRGVAAGRDAATTPVGDVMTDDVVWCVEDADIAEVARLMGDGQIRRLPVVTHAKELVGIVSLADLAVAPGHSEIKADIIEEVSEVR